MYCVRRKDTGNGAETWTQRSDPDSLILIKEVILMLKLKTWEAVDQVEDTVLASFEGSYLQALNFFEDYLDQRVFVVREGLSFDSN